MRKGPPDDDAIFVMYGLLKRSVKYYT